MAAGATYTPIATTTLGSDTASITFSSISGSYTDLILICNGKNTGGSNNEFLVRYNSDSNNNYSTTFLYGNGTSVSSQFSGIASAVIPGQTDNTNPTPIICHINNYSNSTTYKATLCRTSNSAGKVWVSVSTWRNTAAITSIVLSSYTGNLTSGFTATLYGIKAA